MTCLQFENVRKLYVYVIVIYITCIRIFLDRFYCLFIIVILLNMSISISSFPLNDVENDADVLLTVSDMRLVEFWKKIIS